MPGGIRTNRFYNDPAWAQTAGNIASLFAPPSAADTANYALAAERKQQTEGVARMLSDPNNPINEVLGPILQLWAPNQGMPAVRMENDTKRYDIDTDAATALEERRMQEAGLIARQFAEPVKVGQGETAFLPPGTSAATGLASTLYGMPTETGVKAADRIRLQQDGLFTPEMQIEEILGTESPVQVAGPEGPIFTSPGQAVRERLPAYVNRGAEAAIQTENYRGPNGESGTAFFDDDVQQWLDTATRQAIPAGSVTYTGQLSGDAAGTGLGPTTSNTTEANRILAAADAAETLVDTAEDILRKNPNVAGVPGRIKATAQSLVSSAQQTAQAFASEAPTAAMTLDEARNLAEPLLQGNYDPNIVRLQSIVFDLAYMRAQLLNPSGEVSRQAFERSLNSFGQNMLSSQQDLETALAGFRRDGIEAQRVKARRLLGQQAAPSATTEANAEARPRARNPKTGETVEWNGSAWVPVP